jgi:hypothetical protein
MEVNNHSQLGGKRVRPIHFSAMPTVVVITIGKVRWISRVDPLPPWAQRYPAKSVGATVVQVGTNGFLDDRGQGDVNDRPGGAISFSFGISGNLLMTPMSPIGTLRTCRAA